MKTLATRKRAQRSKILGLAVDRLPIYEIPLVATKVPAGFPSPADDYLQDSICLQQLLIAHPQATFLMRVEGHSMINAGIHDGDLVVVDRALTPAAGKVVVAVIDGDFAVKRLTYRDGLCFLESENPAFQPIEVSEFSSNAVWGVVTNVIHRL